MGLKARELTGLVLASEWALEGQVDWKKNRYQAHWVEQNPEAFVPKPCLAEPIHRIPQ